MTTNKADIHRYILRHKPSERKGERLFVILELQVRCGYVSISGLEGYTTGLKQAKEEEALGSEVCLRTKRAVYFLDGCGQITESICQFFPEMKQYMGRHLARKLPEDDHWLTRRFSRSVEPACLEY